MKNKQDNRVENLDLYLRGKHISIHKKGKIGKPLVKRGKHLSNEIRKRMSESANRRCQIPENRKKMSELAKKAWQIPGYKEKMCDIARLREATKRRRYRKLQ